MCVHGREGWAPFSYLEPVHPDSGKGETNSEGSEEEDTLQVNDSTISKYGEYTHVYALYAYIDTNSLKTQFISLAHTPG